MVDCPTCGWSMVKRHEWETGGIVFGNYFCDSIASCPTTIQVKAPTKWMIEKGKWESKK